MKLVLAFVIAIAPMVGNAAGRDGNFSVDGVGKLTCSEFVATKDELEAKRVFAAWTEGFFTAYNVFQDETFDITPWQTIELTLLKMQKFCEQKPDVPYINGLAALLKTYVPGRLQVSDTLVSVRYDGKAVFVYSSLLETIRSKLNEAGLSAGADGSEFNDQFTKALLLYQANTKLPQSGLPDQATLNALLK